MSHDDVEALRKLGECDYFEFTLTKNARQNVAGLGLTLKKTNVKHNRFDLNLLADDLQIEKKGRAIDEPIFFYPLGGLKKPYELVINKVESDRVTGYISTRRVPHKRWLHGRCTKPISWSLELFAWGRVSVEASAHRKRLINPRAG